MSRPAQIFESQPLDTASMCAVDWPSFCQRLRQELGEDVYASWFSRLSFESVQDATAVLSVPTRFLKSWIQSHYLDRLTGLLRAALPDVQHVNIVVRTTESKATTPVIQPSSFAPKATQTRSENGLSQALPPVADQGPLHSSPIDKRYIFSSFLFSKSNAFAHAAAMQCAESSPEKPAPFNPLYIHGGVGLGKTHLVQAIANHAEAKKQRVLYLTAERFMFGFVTALKTQSALAFKEALRAIDVLIVDDVQFLTGKSVQHEFGHTLNALLEGCRQVVVTADRRPSDLEALDERVRSRLAGGLVVEIGAPDDELRRKIVASRVEAAKLRHGNFHVSDAIMDFIARSITSNGRDLDGAVNRLLAHSMLTGGTLTMEAAEEAIRDLVRSGESRRAKIEDIQRIVAQHYNVSRSDLLSARRTATVVRPRQVAIYLSKVLTLRSLPEIGRRFGGRDHTTVLHAVRKIEGLIGRDAQLAQEIESLKQVLQTC